MKLWETYYTQQVKRLRRKRSLRKMSSIKNSGKLIIRRNGRRVTSSFEKIIAPAYLDLYRPDVRDAFIRFVNKIESQSKKENNKKGNKVHICFRNTVHMTAAAGLWLVSKMEYIASTYSQVTYIVTRPPATIKELNKVKSFVVESVLNRIGFYSAIGLATKTMKDDPIVNCWEVLRGELVESEELGGLLEQITERLGISYDGLYRPLIEAMSNSVEHAYREDLYKKEAGAISHKWWCFASILEDKLIVLICDLGVGIPKTLKLTQGEGFLAKIVEILGKPLTSDAEHIKAALQVKRTRTKLGYRGKGGTDLQTIIESYTDSHLRIISNYGNYKYTNRKTVAKPEVIWDGRESIGGTIVEWSIPLQTTDEGRHV